MQTSLFLAKLIGPLFLVMGASVLVNREGYRAMAEEFLKSRALIYLAGLLAFLPGLAIVLTHNVWTADWRVLITIFGWLGFIGGIFRLVFPLQVRAIGTSMIERSHALTIGAGAMLALGLILSFFGYFR